MRVTGKRIFVRGAERRDQTESGIALPGKAGEVPDQGVVAGVGTKVEAEISLGDRVIFIALKALKVDLDGEKYLAINEDDVLAVVVE